MLNRVVLASALFAVATQVSAADRFALVPRMGSPADIVLGSRATEIESHAAGELSSYVRRMTGARLRTLTDISTANGPVVLIGRPETNPAIARLVEQGKIKLSADSPGLDGFIIKTVRDGGRSYLVLGGSMDRSCLYAVYDFLERFCHVGFFWDVERVPKARSLEFGPIDVSARPYFEDRQNMQGCAYGYSAAYWGWQDWKREIDWTAKKKFNILFTFNGREVSKHRALKALGVDAPEPTAKEKGQAALARRIIDYAHSLGIRTVVCGSMGEVPPAFKERYPNAEYIEIQWLDYPPRLYLHPADPLFVRLVSEELRQYNSLYGASNIYNFDPYPETTPGATPEEKTRLAVSFAKAVTQAIRSVSPRGRWVMSGWAFQDRSYWTDERARAFLDAIPDELLIVNDIWAEHRPIYKELNYLYGKRWGFSVLHAFGGNTHLHGDLAGLIDAVQAVARDPKARNCRAFYLNPEIVRHNPFYFDLAGRLAWDPREVGLDDYIGDYAVRRYGAESAVAMTECLKELSASVYSQYDHSGPVYQFSPNPVKPRKLEHRVRWASSLKRAIDGALAESPRQRGNECYERDLVDIAKEYLGDLVTIACDDLVKACGAGDGAAFDSAARRMRAGMDAVEGVLALCSDYYLAEEIGRATQPPFNLRPRDAAVDVRTRYTYLVDFEHYDTLLDYARKDMYELVKHYYRPRMDFLISHLRDCMAAGKGPSEQEVHDGCKEIARKFVHDSPAVEMPGHPRDVAGAVAGELSCLP